MKKGFTLVELMAVLIVLGVIIAISFPIVGGLLTDSKEELYNIQIKEIEDAAKNMALEDSNLLNENAVTCINLINILKSGKINQKEIIDPRTNEKMEGSVVVTYNAEYSQYEYKYQESACSVARASISSLKSRTSNKTTNCLDNGKCNSGSVFMLEVAPNLYYNFYVISDIDKVITLIMDKNLIPKSPYSTEKTTQNGPIDMLRELEHVTSNWVNIKDGTYITYGVTENNSISKYGTITRVKAKTRLLSLKEAISLGCTVNLVDSCPKWLTNSLSKNNDDINPYGFWLSTVSSNSEKAFAIDYMGSVVLEQINEKNYSGIRPVIEIRREQ